ncbi:SPW repeat domain-containing protein [Anaeromyxobacter oryzae]|uniref:SPW repeat-containing integral membrane domain-containing protein n=1 Tax=Anaeromyxobacter oryzae TaxID=2918170 RepID=A0ABN6MWA9_9BACT|nr:SPW repeat protein [Anaeromyxobacter oryzae]BDG04094.1 hypothetical protein AMOR_30900 [Anaeromyxobacter oryzae]
MSNRVNGARVANLILGVWLFVSAFIWQHSAPERTSTWIMGVVVAVFALIAMRASQARWVNTAAAIWTFIAVWALPHSNLGTQWNNALVAIAVFLLSLVPGENEPGFRQPVRTTT